MIAEPRLLKGGSAVDDRGEVYFVNEFDFRDVKRFYMVSNHRRGFVRAWHGHRRETKYVTAVHGSFLICCIRIDDWNNPPESPAIHRFVLSERVPGVVCVPAGHVNGFMSLSEGGKLMFFSTLTLQDSLDDDVRFPARKWDPWSVEER